MKIKITSDGTPAGTRVVNLDTGEDLSKWVTSVSWEHSAVGDMPIATLSLIAAQVEVVGKVPAVELEDGLERFEYGGKFYEASRALNAPHENARLIGEKQG
jgi:hypothetical protein